MYSKIAVRQKMIDERLSLTNKEIIYFSDIISNKTICFIRQKFIKSAALYMSIKNEVKIELVIDKIINENIKIYLPYCKKKSDICFYKFKDTDSLVKDDYGILSSKCGRETAINEIDAFFVPGVAFDTSGNRIGYGKGCYDKVLAKSKIDSIFIGICYNFQIYKKNEIEITQNDIKMHYLICESGIINCSDYI
ncbi:MAG: 5-formyltetrahydrofolate cyclo-ligase [Candidatus Acididesulfobacter diazotrophicus]|jgi:5-formyltetrahydrofolate cyclo-ligase|uniref:5-formyltetrahydrofolate cyclo-ligase n=1 Tax=Candidatus Acididesulfobacter diazotrophicus TaxID=2597226 RepID=A0A519BNJ9_9DELT|nr:MAG: 5-formyltetrahydrofolate cyclo-ligase [Candidatus Acididesulfobacter diazotrophicus]